MDIWKSIQSYFEACDEHLAEIDKILDDVDSRNKSPEIGELETITIDLEDHLQRTLGQIQHTSVKVNNLLVY